MYIGNFYFNIIYLHNRNIVMVARSQLFNISVHLYCLSFIRCLYIAFYQFYSFLYILFSPKYPSYLESVQTTL